MTGDHLAGLLFLIAAAPLLLALAIGTIGCGIAAIIAMTKMTWHLMKDAWKL